MTAAAKWTERIIRPRMTTAPPPVDVLASCRGPLAVHPTLRVGLGAGWSLSETHYTVTHVPTRMAIRRDLTRVQAFALAEKLLALDIDWDFRVAARMPAATKAALKAAYQEYGPVQRVAA